MTTVAVTCIKNGRTDTFGRPLVSGTYYPEIDREHARSLWNSGFVSVADTSVFDDDPLSGTSPLGDFNVARAIAISRQPEQTGANLAAELAAINAAAAPNVLPTIALIGDSRVTSYWVTTPLAFVSPIGNPVQGVNVELRGAEGQATPGGTGALETTSAGMVRWTAPSDAPGPWTQAVVGRMTLASGTPGKGFTAIFWQIPSVSTTISVTLAASVGHNLSGWLYNRHGIMPSVESEFALVANVVRLGAGGSRVSDCVNLIPWYAREADGSGYDVFCCGTNSISNNVALETMTASAATILNDRLLRGRKIVIIGETARYTAATSNPLISSQLQLLIGYNKFLREFALARPASCRYVDAFALTADPSFSDGRPAAGMLYDAQHYGLGAGKAVGSAVVAALKSLGLSSVPVFPSRVAGGANGWNAFNDVGYFFGTSGTVGANITSVGGIPDWYSSSGTANAAATWEKVVISDDHQTTALRCTYSSTAAAGQYTRVYGSSMSALSLASLGLVAGDVIQYYVDITVESCGPDDTIYSLCYLTGASGAARVDAASAPGRYRLFSPPITILPGGTALLYHFRIDTSATAASSGSVLFADPMFRKVA